MEIKVKKCKGCEDEKALEEYSNDKRWEDGLSKYCRSCNSEYYKGIRVKRKSPPIGTTQDRENKVINAFVATREFVDTLIEGKESMITFRINDREKVIAKYILAKKYENYIRFEAQRKGNYGGVKVVTATIADVFDKTVKIDEVREEIFV